MTLRLRERMLKPLRLRLRDMRESGEMLRELGPRDLERGPLASRLTARPPTTASARWRFDFLSGSRSSKRSNPPAPMAAVAIRLPFSPCQGPGSLRLRKASTAPAMRAACAACAHLRSVCGPPRPLEDDDEPRRLLPPRERDRPERAERGDRSLSLSLSFPRIPPTSAPRPRLSTKPSTPDLRRSRSRGGERESSL